MNTQDQINYYRKSCIKFMNTIEDRTKKMIHESEHKALEAAFWSAVDAKDLNKIKSIHNSLAKITDAINEL